MCVWWGRGVYPNLTYDESGDVIGFPIRRVKEVWQGCRREIAKRLGRVKTVIDSLRAPPEQWNEEGKEGMNE